MFELPGPTSLRFPPIWREGRTPIELASLLRDPLFRSPDPKAGGGRPVLLIPGFLAGDGSLGLMTEWLRRAGYHAHRARMRANVDCSAAALEGLELRTEVLAERHGQRVAVIGQSRGGTFARALGAMRPDVVDAVVTLGTPQLSPLAVHPLILLQVGVLGALGTLGVPGLFKQSCLRGECCRRFRESFEAPFPDDVRYVSVYSRSDGIVDWRACLDPAAELVEIEASHIGMAVNPQAYRIVAETLRPAAGEKRGGLRLAA